ncbi:hypothetical protein GGS24DRAFT_132585 [Hypoxylon argillaceum]|nr:hypothetical protein GGS24DRAFT_132585 [Hypoxylon argillaceum]
MGEERGGGRSLPIRPFSGSGSEREGVAGRCRLTRQQLVSYVSCTYREWSPSRRLRTNQERSAEGGGQTVLLDGSLCHDMSAPRSPRSPRSCRLCIALARIPECEYNNTKPPPPRPPPQYGMFKSCTAYTLWCCALETTYLPTHLIYLHLVKASLTLVDAFLSHSNPSIPIPGWHICTLQLLDIALYTFSTSGTPNYPRFLQVGR